MIKHYIKQAWQLLKQNKLFSTVYIVGTGMAIAMMMTLAIIYYIKIAPVYPEVNRDRTLTVKSAVLEYRKINNMSSSSIAYDFVRDHFYTMETPEVVTAVLEKWEDVPLIELTGGKGVLPVKPAYVDANFWKVFEFSFLNGKPFSDHEFQSGIRAAVITASLANTLFGTKEAEGQPMVFNGNEYRVSGVVRDASYATPTSFAQLWLPYTVEPEELEDGNWGKGLLGPMSVYMLAPSKSEKEAVCREVDEFVRKINASQDEYTLDLKGQPDSQWETVFRGYSNKDIDWGEVAKTLGVILLALLIVPTVNLAGMISSRMEKRLPEMGIRKSFGASKRTLFNQLLIENLLFTTLGGIVGLLFSYLIMYGGRNWLITLFDNFPDVLPEGVDTALTMEMLFNPVVLLITFTVCFILNTLSAIVPVYFGLKKDIVYSLNSKK